jgi:hypothetical protein
VVVVLRNCGSDDLSVTTSAAWRGFDVISPAAIEPFIRIIGVFILRKNCLVLPVTALAYVIFLWNQCAHWPDILPPALCLSLWLTAVEFKLASRDQILHSQAVVRLQRWRTADQGATPRMPSGATFGTKSPTATILKPEAAPVPLPIVPVAIDLLSIDDATRVQRRLSELGYLKDAANGTWGPASRAAMRVFKVANGLGDDDRVDAASAGTLLSQSAKIAPEGLVSIRQSTEMALYAGPKGARLNPINPVDASTINAKLRELGFYKGRNDAVWSGASRLALKEFKKVAGIAGDDGWDPLTESALLSDTTPTPAPANLDIAFEASVGGVWAASASHCPPSRGTSPPIVISRERATAGEQACQFLEKRGGGQQWDVRALCRSNGASWTANIRLVRDGATLGWSSERGSIVYHRCTR